MTIVTTDMLRAWFDEAHPDLKKDDKLYLELWSGFLSGAAAYAHLQSPASDEWRAQHGFNEKDILQAT